MSNQLHSLRMHASRGARHVSGAERLLGFAEIEEVAAQMVRRALAHPRGPAERICLNLETVAAAQVRRAALLPLSTHRVADWREGRRKAAELLVAQGLDAQLVQEGIDRLAGGPAPDGGVMRGAMLIDVASGARLEPDPQRGVRVSRMDIAAEFLPAVKRYLQQYQLDSARVVEAWALASKVAFYPQIVAELCWSDDPDYVTGYVGSARGGYQRITRLKAAGDPIGGRIFFVRCAAAGLAELIAALQYEPVLLQFAAMPGE